MNFNGSFGGWLKQRRKALDLTQAQLADHVGCTVTNIQKIEAGLRRPSKQIVARMKEVLALSPDESAAFMSFARRLPEQSSVSSIESIAQSNLPPQLTSFVGRQNELNQIASRLLDPNCRLLTLVGHGGIGKTRLALLAAQTRVGEFVDGVHFIPLASISSPSLIATAIGNQLQLSFNGHENPDAQIVNHLRGKHILLVIDNYEHLLPEITLLTNLVASAPHVKMLVTSRERLGLQEEWVLLLNGLSFPASQTHAPSEDYSAVELFNERAKQVKADFSPVENIEAIKTICQQLDGMPLGIELAASWLHVLNCSQIASRIATSLDFLTTHLRNVLPRHRSLRAVLELTLNCRARCFDAANGFSRGI